MKKNNWKLLLQRLAFSVLIATMVLTFAGCGNNEDAATDTMPQEEATEMADEAADEGVATVDEPATLDEPATEGGEAPEGQEPVAEVGTPVGEGDTKFTFEVKHEDGTVTYYAVSTDATTVGEALLELELIAGDDSEYGLYVKTVDGVTVDPDAESKYWAFYVDGEMAATGVDLTDITEGAMYSFAVESF